MNHFKTILLAAVLCVVGGVKMMADVITSASQLSNTKVYTIRTTRGYMTLNTAQTTIVSSHKSDGGTVNDAAATDDASKQFGIINYDGKYFIYSPKLNKFACLQGQNLIFYNDRGVALDITNNGSGNPDGSKLRFFAHGMGSEGYNKWCLNNNNSGSLVLNSYTTAEAGNTVSIEEVAGATLDIDAAMAVFNGTPHFFDPHKVYNITNGRITNWTANSGNTGLTGTKAYSGATDAQQQFAFFKYDGKQYLYNVGAQKFVATDGSLTASKGDAATIAVWYTGDTFYPYCFYIEERGLLFNGQTGGGFAINAWNSSIDAGNEHNLVEVADVDVYNEILAFFEIPSWDVTYNVYYNGEKIGEEVRTQDKGSDAALSSAWNNDFVTFTYSPTTITDGVTSVDATITWTGPTLYSDYESIEWKNLYVDRTYDGADGSKCYLANTGDAPKYYVKNPTDKQRASDAFQWGFVGNPYQLKVYNKLAGPTQTLHPSNTIGMEDGDSYWSIKIRYNGGFMIGKTGNTNSFINQAGGYNGTSMGYWSSTTDYGNVFKFDDVPVIPVTNVYFDITFNGQVVYTVVASGSEVGDAVPEMPTVTLPAWTTVTAPDVTGQTVTENMHIEVPATWNGPFEISADFASAHWYDMAMRKEEGKQAYYVTSAKKDSDGAYQTQLANTMGLVEDSYQWAFLGNPFEGFKIINKAEGDGKSFGWTDETAVNQGIPTIMSDETGHHAWKIVPSTNTNVPTGSFCLNVPGTNLYINQYGGAGGSVKFWNSTGNIGDAGSAFTVFDVPSNFASFVVDEIAPSIEATGYFSLTGDAKAALGWDEAYKTECSFDQYKALKEALAAIDMTNFDNFIIPNTGYYTLKNKNYGTYMGIDPSDCNLYGDYESANLPKHIVKLTRVSDSQFTISLEGVYAPVSVAQSQPVTAAVEGGTYTVSIPTIGYAAFQADTNNNMSCLHCRAAGDLVGWEAPAAASQWMLEDATSISGSITDAGYASLYVPFPVTVPDGVTAYTGKINGSYLTLTEVEGTIPANTAVVLQGEASNYQFNIANEELGPIEENDIYGVCIEAAVSIFTDDDINILTLQKYNDNIGFFKFTGETLAANKVFLALPKGSDVKALTFDFDNPTGLESVTEQKATIIYDLAGRRVSHATKGIYIQNGQKILVK